MQRVFEVVTSPSHLQRCVPEALQQYHTALQLVALLRLDWQISTAKLSRSVDVVLHSYT